MFRLINVTKSLFSHLKYFRGWLELKQVSPLQEDFEDKKAESTGKDFDLSFLTMEKSTADEEFPELDGTLPKKTSKLMLILEKCRLFAH
jgi:hypothetical protein